MMGCSPRSSDDLAPVVTALLGLWDEADLVCLGEQHGDLADHALRTALIRHPDFARTVRVIVVEFVNPVHQNLLDRWILHGADGARDELRRLWRDAGASVIWDLPIYEEFLRAVRDVNRGRAAADRVRVVGGTAPVPWHRVEEPEDLLPWRDRGSWIVDTVRREVLAPALKGLAIYGAGHCERSGMGFPARLMADEAVRTRAVFGFHGTGGRRAARETLGVGPAPQWLAVRGTPLADVPAGEMLFEVHAYSGATLGELADALIYFPSPATDRDIQPETTADREFERELQRRWRLLRAAQAIEPESHRSPD